MKKNLLLALAALPIGFGLYAQSNVIIDNNLTGKFQFVSGDEYESEISFTIGDVVSKAVTTPNGTQYTISTLNGTPILEAGYPDLPKITSSIIVPDNDNMQVQVLEAVYTDYTNIDVAPSKGTLVRTVDPASVPFNYGDIYNNDVFYPFDLAHLGHPYIFRDYRAQTVTVNPVQYNAVTKTLRVYTHIRLAITTSGTEVENSFERNSNVNSIEREFSQLYSQRFLNYDNISSSARYTSIDDNGSLLIICHPAFEGNMAPYVNWKIQRGMPTEMVNTTTTGTTVAAIKSYITTYLSSHPSLKYVLFVGDHAQIPAAEPGTYTLAGPSDNWYGYISGNDHYPELFIGRFSGTTPAHINTLVQRSVNYEKTPLIDASFGKSVHIGSAEGPGDDGQMDYEHQRGLLNELQNFTYTYSDELFDGSQGGDDAAGNPSAMDVVDVMNEGRGVITYTGHGWDQGIASSSFSSSEVPLLTNTGKLPFFWSVACVNGNFTTQTCFAETLTRQTNASGEPVGCVATLMSTINQYWSEPMEGQDEMVHLLTLNSVGYNKKTFGALSMNGCMQMNDAYGSSGNDMTDTWTLFGDPSLLVRTATPIALTATHVSSDVPGITTVNVTSTVNGAFVAITMNNTILGTGTIASGSANVTIPTVSEGDVLTVTVTAFNHVPHIGTVTITQASASINENALPGVNIYPNPTTDFISIHTTNNALVDLIMVYDMMGKIVYTNNTSVSGQYNIATAGWAKGTYNVQLSSNGKTNTTRVVLK